MRRPRCMMLMSTLVCAGPLASGCQPAPSSGRGGQAQTQGAPAAQEAPAAVLPAAEEPAALLLTDTKLLRFDAEGLREVEGPAGPYVDLFTAGGQLQLLTASALFVARDGRFVEQVGFGELAGVEGAALGPEDAPIYLSTGAGVAWREGDAWSSSSSAQLGYAEGERLGVAYDGEDRIWVVGAERAIFRVPGSSEWRETDKSLVGQGFEFGNASPASFGPVHVNNNHRLSRIHPSFLDSVLVDPKAKKDYELLALAADGHALVSTRDCELGRVNPHPPTKIWRFAAKDYACTSAQAIALDDQLRAWVVSAEGLSVIDDGRSVRELPLELDAPVRRILVLGEGPALPS